MMFSPLFEILENSSTSQMQRKLYVEDKKVLQVKIWGAAKEVVLSHFVDSNPKRPSFVNWRLYIEH